MSDSSLTKEKIERAVRALAVAALHHGPEAERAFERMLDIQTKFEKRELLLQKAREIVRSSNEGPT
ncbi:MAG: hypothetical protein ABJN26_05510 [Stappiaceae bacterium]